MHRNSICLSLILCSLSFGLSFYMLCSSDSDNTQISSGIHIILEMNKSVENQSFEMIYTIGRVQPLMRGTDKNFCFHFSHKSLEIFCQNIHQKYVFFTYICDIKPSTLKPSVQRNRKKLNNILVFESHIYICR